jgi:hypothetical protein
MGWRTSSGQCALEGARSGPEGALASACACARGAPVASEPGGRCTVPRARNGKSCGYQTRSVSRLGGWVRWIGCAAVWEAGRAVCGERHLEQTQGYALTENYNNNTQATPPVHACRA